MPLAALCRRHSSADFTICMCEFDFRLEHAGNPYHVSSNESWAASDLDRVMDEAAANGPLFINAFYTACEQLKQRRPKWRCPRPPASTVS
jgi:hypothetical protein